jgi:hypothetical protein
MWGKTREYKNNSIFFILRLRKKQKNLFDFHRNLFDAIQCANLNKNNIKQSR